MRADLINEYVQARLQFGDLDEDQEEMRAFELRRHLRNHAESLTNEQLVSACNSYTLAD